MIKNEKGKKKLGDEREVKKMRVRKRRSLPQKTSN